MKETPRFRARISAEHAAVAGWEQIGTYRGLVGRLQRWWDYRSSVSRWQRWQEAWFRHRDRHVAERLTLDPQPFRQTKIYETPWVYLECACPCKCPNAFNYRTYADIAWPTRCRTCARIDRLIGFLGPFPEWPAELKP